MHPILFEIGNWPVYSYGVLLALAYLAGLQLAVVRARRAGLDGTKVMDFGIYLIIAALVGAKLMLVIVDFDYFRNQPRELFSLVRAGGVFYGGLIGALLAAIVGCGGSGELSRDEVTSIGPGDATGTDRSGRYRLNVFLDDKEGDLLDSATELATPTKRSRISSRLACQDPSAAITSAWFVTHKCRTPAAAAASQWTRRGASPSEDRSSWKW